MNRRLAVPELRPPPPAPCGANTPITWGELYILLHKHQPVVAADVLKRIVEIDRASAQSMSAIDPQR